jgi:DnaJ-class molecular chaperone
MKFSLTSCLILLWVSFIAKAADYYQTLDLRRDCTEDEIKRAFRKLSIKFHPDKNPGDEEAAQKFIEVNKAHEILTDPEKRQIYDLQGDEGLDRHEKGQNNPWGQQGGVNKGPNAYAEISVSLEELYNGAEKDMTIQRNILCPQCRGTGAKDGKTKQCPSCQGRGVRMQNVQVGFGFNMQMQVTCDKCGGRGHVHVTNCPHCSGKRVVPNSKTLHVEVEKGMPDGKQIVFERESEQSPDHMPGDVIFTLKTRPHNTFHRIGDNLYTTLQLDLKDALLGFKKQIKHLDGHFTQIEKQEVTQPFEVKIIKEEGMPIHHVPSSFGDLHTKFVVKLPKKLTQKDKDLLNKIFDN